MRFIFLLTVFHLRLIPEMSARFLLLYHLRETNVQIILSVFTGFTLSQEPITENVFRAMPSGKCPRHFHRLAPIMEWIRINICNDLSVLSVASHFSMNPDYLSRLFAKYLGMGTKQYINLQRINTVYKHNDFNTRPWCSIDRRMPHFCSFPRFLFGLVHH